MAAVSITSIRAASSGVWQGDNPLHSAFLLLIVQTILVLLLKPLRQPPKSSPRSSSEAVGARPEDKTYLHNIFPSWSTPILETVASIGLLFFLFLVGLELDLHSIPLSGRRAFAIAAAAGISLPFACGVDVAFVLRAAVHGADEPGYAPFFKC